MKYRPQRRFCWTDKATGSVALELEFTVSDKDENEGCLKMTGSIENYPSKELEILIGHLKNEPLIADNQRIQLKMRTIGTACERVGYRYEVPEQIT